MIGRLLVVSGLVAALITGCGSAVRPDCQIVMWDVGQSPPEEGAPMPAEVEPLIMPADVDWGSSQFGRGAIGQPTVTLALGPDGATRMAEFTRSNIGSYVAIALNGSFFNTQRMVRQYVHNAYFPGGVPEEVAREATAVV